MSTNNPFENLKAGAEVVAAKVAPKLAADVVAAKADVAKAQAAIVKADSWLAAFIKNNSGKIATGVLVAVGLAIWHYLF